MGPKKAVSKQPVEAPALSPRLQMKKILEKQDTETTMAVQSKGRGPTKAAEESLKKVVGAMVEAKATRGRPKKQVEEEEEKEKEEDGGNEEEEEEAKPKVSPKRGRPKKQVDATKEDDEEEEEEVKPKAKAGRPGKPKNVPKDDEEEVVKHKVRAEPEGPTKVPPEEPTKVPDESESVEVEKPSISKKRPASAEEPPAQVKAAKIGAISKRVMRVDMGEAVLSAEPESAGRDTLPPRPFPPSGAAQKPQPSSVLPASPLKRSSSISSVTSTGSSVGRIGKKEVAEVPRQEWVDALRKRVGRCDPCFQVKRGFDVVAALESEWGSDFAQEKLYQWGSFNSVCDREHLDAGESRCGVDPFLLYDEGGALIPDPDPAHIYSYDSTKAAPSSAAELVWWGIRPEPHMLGILKSRREELERKALQEAEQARKLEEQARQEEERRRRLLAPPPLPPPLPLPPAPPQQHDAYKHSNARGSHYSRPSGNPTPPSSGGNVNRYGGYSRDNPSSGHGGGAYSSGQSMPVHASHRPGDAYRKDNYNSNISNFDPSRGVGDKFSAFRDPQPSVGVNRPPNGNRSRSRDRRHDSRDRDGPLRAGHVGGGHGWQRDNAPRYDAYGRSGDRPDAYGRSGDRPDAYGRPGDRPDAYGRSGDRPGTYGRPGDRPDTYGRPGDRPEGSWRGNEHRGGPGGPQRFEPRDDYRRSDPRR